MLGALTTGQIEQVLQRNFLGRLGCSVSKRAYVTPLSFAYHNDSIYGNAKDGLKIQMMRSNPQVCFQVDEIDNMANWRSVICWGNYEEITEAAEQEEALQLLNDRLAPLITSESARRHSADVDPPHIVEKEVRAILFRIRITEKTGRFEKTP